MYKLVTGTVISKFNEEVSSLISKGYVPLGAVMIDYHNPIGYFYQSLWKPSQ